MNTSSQADIVPTASWEVFHRLGATLDRAPATVSHRPPRSPARSGPPAVGRLAGQVAAQLAGQAEPRHVDVVIAHPSPIIAQGLSTTLRQHAGISTAVCEDEKALRERLASPAPCLIFSDYHTAVAGARAPDATQAAAWVCVTTLDRAPDIRGALRAGVFGYLLADCALSDYLACVQRAGSEERFLCQRSRQLLIEAPRGQGLSARELGVLRLVEEGLSNQDIAERLHITVSTVKLHVGKVLKKLNARSRTQAAALAREGGLLAGSEGS